MQENAEPKPNAQDDNWPLGTKHSPLPSVCGPLPCDCSARRRWVQYRFGTSGVGIIEGPGTINWDFAMAKSFNLTERAKLRFEASFVNFLNHVNLGIPDMNAGHPNNPAQGLCGFGCITSAQGLYQFAGARSGQVGARIDF